MNRSVLPPSFPRHSPSSTLLVSPVTIQFLIVRWGCPSNGVLYATKTRKQCGTWKKRDRAGHNRRDDARLTSTLRVTASSSFEHFHQTHKRLDLTDGQRSVFSTSDMFNGHEMMTQERYILLSSVALGPSLSQSEAGNLSTSCFRITSGRWEPPQRRNQKEQQVPGSIPSRNAKQR